jgi:hypothetical protein
LEKLAKEAISAKGGNQKEKTRMTEINNSLKNGSLKQAVAKHDKQLNELFQHYWLWDKKSLFFNMISYLLM